MNKFYIIVPAVLLGAFLFIYSNFLKELNFRDAQKAEEVQRQKTELAARKKLAEQKASEDARLRQEQRDKDERDSEAKKLRKQKEDDDKIAADTQRYVDESDQFSKDSARLQAELDDLRAKRETFARAELALDKATELGRIARRNADLEIQRMTEMISRKVALSSLAKMPAATTEAAQ
jgi:hypothetical protein